MGTWTSQGDLEVAVVQAASMDQTATTAATRIKTATYPHWNWVKWDGETAVVLDNVLTVLRTVETANPPRFLIRTTFSQTNVTQNNKGNHDAHFEVKLLGRQKEVLGAPAYSPVTIARDFCWAHGSNPLATAEVELPFDVFDRVAFVHYNWFMRWTYEGGC